MQHWPCRCLLLSSFCVFNSLEQTLVLLWHQRLMALTLRLCASLCCTVTTALYNIYVYIYICESLQSLDIYNIHIHIHRDIHRDIHICMCIHTVINIYLYINIYTHIHRYIRVYIYTYIYIYYVYI